jgi:DNA-directed RNA polymerase subunit beta
MTDDEVIESARELNKGIVMKTPVFDGADETEIWDLLKRAGLPDDGKARAFRRPHRRSVP